MIIHINKKEISVFISIFLLLLYSFTKAGIHELIYKSSIICYLSFLIALLCMLRVTGVRKNPINSYLKLWFFLCVLVLLINRNQNFANGEFEDGIAFVFIFLYFLLAVETTKWHKYFWNIMLIWGLIHAFFTIVEYLIPGFYMSIIFPIMPSYAQIHLSAVFKMGYMPGIAAHYSTNGMYLAVAFIPAFVRLLLQKRKSLIQLAALMIIAAGLLLTGKRGVLIFSVFGILISYYVYNSDKPLGRIGKMVVLLVFGTVVFMVGSQFIPGLANFIDRFQKTAAQGDITLGRLSQFAMAFQQISRNPLLGSGWDSFKYDYRALFGTLLNVHNVFIQLIAENGVIGAFPFFAFFTLAFRRAVKRLRLIRRNRSAQEGEELALMMSVAAQAFFLLYCLTGNPLYDQQVLFPYICSVAMGEYYIEADKRTYSVEYMEGNT